MEHKLKKGDHVRCIDLLSPAFGLHGEVVDVIPPGRKHTCNRYVVNFGPAFKGHDGRDRNLEGSRSQPNKNNWWEYSDGLEFIEKGEGNGSK